MVSARKFVRCSYKCDCTESHNLLQLKHQNDTEVFVDCKTERFVEAPAGSNGSTKRSGAASGIILLDWALKKFTFIPNNESTKTVMTCMTEHLHPSFNTHPGLWVQVWMDAKDPECAEPWWNFAWSISAASRKGNVPVLLFQPFQ